MIEAQNENLIRTNDPSTDEAYRVCREIARREAQNFYWAFRVLPRHKSDAMCAVYAFMRRADDISDDESKSIETRRAEMSAWLESWRTSRVTPSSDPVFLALGDTQRRFRIPDDLLEELVAGTTMDLAPRPPELNEQDPGSEALQTFATFEDLYKYCYLVASVVGLVCIRIFGYTDPAAEKLAEETGVAFQLTNILRDVAEDAERGRVYLPLADLAAHHITLDSLQHRPAGSAPTQNERALLADIGRRAEYYYASATKLLPLINPESRPAMWVLVKIYRGLLKRIRRADYDVFSRRISVPTFQKLEILAVGIARLALARITG